MLFKSSSITEAVTLAYEVARAYYRRMLPTSLHQKIVKVRVLIIERGWDLIARKGVALSPSLVMH
jgi:hypothetical protein